MYPSGSGPIVAITGATGYVGRFVMDDLQQHGALVRALARPGSDRSGFAAAVDWVEGDIRSEVALRALVQGVEAVVHLAYEHTPGRYRDGEGADPLSWLDANVMGSLRLLVLAAEAGARRFVFLSSRAVFSRTEDGRLLDEAHPLSPDSHYGAYKAAVEAFLHSFQRQNDMLTFAVRATGVYGVTRPVERSKWWNLIVRALAGEVDFPQRGGTEVFAGDVSRVVWALMQRPDADLDGIDVIHLSDLYVTNADIVRIARRVAGLPDEHGKIAASSPENALESRNLRRLGIQLGGVAALEDAVAQMVRTAQTISAPHK